jgi:hypothetical protein
MTLKLSGLRNGFTLHPINIFLFLSLVIIFVIGRANPQGPIRPERWGKLRKSISSSGLELANLRLPHPLRYRVSTILVLQWHCLIFCTFWIWISAGTLTFPNASWFPTDPQRDAPRSNLLCHDRSHPIIIHQSHHRSPLTIPWFY